MQPQTDSEKTLVSMSRSDVAQAIHVIRQLRHVVARQIQRLQARHVAKGRGKLRNFVLIQDQDPQRLQPIQVCWQRCDFVPAQIQVIELRESQQFILELGEAVLADQEAPEVLQAADGLRKGSEIVEGNVKRVQMLDVACGVGEGGEVIGSDAQEAEAIADVVR